MSNLVVTLAALSARVLPVSMKKAIYRFGPIARLVRNELNRAVPSGLTNTIVAGGELAGMSMILDLQSEKDYWLGTYEPNLQAAVREFVRPGMAAYDVGANIGQSVNATSETEYYAKRLTDSKKSQRKRDDLG